MEKGRFVQTDSTPERLLSVHQAWWKQRRSSMLQRWHILAPQVRSKVVRAHQQPRLVHAHVWRAVITVAGGAVARDEFAQL